MKPSETTVSLAQEAGLVAYWTTPAETGETAKKDARRGKRAKTCMMWREMKTRCKWVVNDWNGRNLEAKSERRDEDS